LEGAVERAFEVGFVASEIVVFGRLGGAFGVGSAEGVVAGHDVFFVQAQEVQDGEVVFALEVAVEHFGFDAEASLESPGGSDDPFEKEVLEGAGGLEELLELLAEFVEFGLVLVVEEESLGEQAVTEGILGDGGFAFRGCGAGALAGVMTVGEDLFLGSHGLVLS